MPDSATPSREGFAERRGGDRRQTLRRREDRQALTRTMLAALVSICGGLAALYLFLAAIGAVDVDQALVASGVALGLGIVWFVAFTCSIRIGVIHSPRSWMGRCSISTSGCRGSSRRCSSPYDQAGSVASRGRRQSPATSRPGQRPRAVGLR